MELLHAGQASDRRKRKIRLFSGLFIGLLVVFTLLSNTFMALTIPKVAVVVPSRGQLVHKFKGSGVIKWRAEITLTNSTGWKVKKVEVKEGDRVKKGQTLVTYDSHDAEQDILDQQAGLNKLKLTMEELQSHFIEASQNGEEKSIEDAKRAMDIHKIDLEVQQRKIQNLQEKLKKNVKLTAPFNGIVTKVIAKEGLSSENGGYDVRLSDESLGFEFELSVPVDTAAELKTGDKLEVQVDGPAAEKIEGQISEIREPGIPDPSKTEEGSTGEGGKTAMNLPTKRLLVTMQGTGTGLKEGAGVRVELSRATDPDILLVANKAIHEDNTGKYVFTIEERNGPLGNAFYIHRTSITVTDSDDKVSMVTQGLFEQQQIVVESSEPLQDGDKVRMQ
ncbi:HlyD family secretion protein [Paenibacillus chitinolyticus]|uniref:Efflux RND transporter periplasmic adaptor subunit n=1 Tax=Paenibacillus chitinolyticus TaxID=79263 RepID=A0A410WTU4_9BACL|nr:efflux RND transporter periplasmic adaptor subunit [Paenibacillus chitinolyticus]MCY9591332.1 efflux RND transporter periplasmic adaptor subunit [Paenibacillus chitinolyticus]MCY9597393.1 efflux RND transporter periplasmic adaptor subunit [Paenibacillus chitinolyticus]QAV17773.1 HlyD family secretion protein [Paenibacillus chitinolyticus]